MAKSNANLFGMNLLIIEKYFFFESECILAEKQNQTIENKFKSILSEIRDLEGETKIREMKTRINQNVFRQIVLANYSGKCCNY